LSSATALEAIYASLINENHEIDQRIAELKEAMKAESLKEIVVDASRIAQNNRQGRKTMQSYFKKRGVSVKFNTES